MQSTSRPSTRYGFTTSFGMRLRQPTRQDCSCSARLATVSLIVSLRPARTKSSIAADPDSFGSLNPRRSFLSFGSLTTGDLSGFRKSAEASPKCLECRVHIGIQAKWSFGSLRTHGQPQIGCSKKRTENRMNETTPSLSAGRYPSLSETSVRSESHSSGVSWAAVMGGAFVTAALSLILLALGTGLGFSSVSPWSNVGASASTIGTAAIAWLILMQVISSSMGGYLAGRLRTKWANIHTDEVYFRDTAHGFLAWAVALVITAAFLTSAATYMVGGAASSAAGGAATGVRADGRELESNEYFVDTLFRSESV